MSSDARRRPWAPHSRSNHFLASVCACSMVGWQRRWAIMPASAGGATRQAQWPAGQECLSGCRRSGLLGKNARQAA